MLLQPILARAGRQAQRQSGVEGALAPSAGEAEELAHGEDEPMAGTANAYTPAVIPSAAPALSAAEGRDLCCSLKARRFARGDSHRRRHLRYRQIIEAILFGAASPPTSQRGKGSRSTR
jgi:hypothetical protein